MRRLILTMIMSIVLTARVWAAAPELHSSVDKAFIAPGDSIRFEIQLIADPGQPLTIPPLPEKIEGFRIVGESMTGPERRDARMVTTRLYALRADNPGSFVLPPVEVIYTENGESKTVRTSEIYVEVKAGAQSSSHDSASQEGLRDIKPLASRPPPFRDILLWSVLGGFVPAFAYALYRWMQRGKRAAPAAADLPCDQWALAALQKLRANPGFDWVMTDTAMRKKYYFRLSEIFRGYLERRFEFGASDLTTEEIAAHLKTANLSDESKRWALQFLRDTDLVKFTDLVPAAGDPKRLWDLAESFIVRTRPAPTAGQEAAA